MRNLKFILIIGGILVLIGAVIGYYLYTKPVAQTANISPSHNISVAMFTKDFAENPKQANDKYSNQVVQITGDIKTIEKDAEGNVNYIFEDNNVVVQCSFSGKSNEEAASHAEGDRMTIRGKYTGYMEDDLLGGLTVKLNEGFIPPL